MDDPLTNKETALALGVLLSPVLILAGAFLVRGAVRARVAWWQVVLALVGGGGVILVVQQIVGPSRGSELQVLLQRITGPSAYETVVRAPLLEETLKALIVAPFLLSSRIRSEIAGFLIGFVSGMGFALMENHQFYEAASNEDLVLRLLWSRNLFATPGHALTTALVGAALGHVGRVGWSRRSAVFVAGAWLLACALHATSNAWVQWGPATWVTPGLSLNLVLAIAAIAIVRRIDRRDATGAKRGADVASS